MPLTPFIFSDLWVADSQCATGCSSVSTFDSSASSTFHNQSTPFSITYGSGQAAGSLGQDVVQMAGYSVPNQIFAVCNQVSPGLLTKPVSGLLGLGFQTIASSRAMPLWQTLVESGAWDNPLMSFYLTRLVDKNLKVSFSSPSDLLFFCMCSYLNSTSVLVEEPGGSFSMGNPIFIQKLKVYNLSLLFQVSQTQVYIRVTLNISTCQFKPHIGSYQ